MNILHWLSTLNISVSVVVRFSRDVRDIVQIALSDVVQYLLVVVLNISTVSVTFQFVPNLCKELEIFVRIVVHL